MIEGRIAAPLPEEAQWQRFHASRCPRAREWLIERYKPLVEQVIRRFRSFLSPIQSF